MKFNQLLCFRHKEKEQLKFLKKNNQKLIVPKEDDQTTLYCIKLSTND